VLIADEAWQFDAGAMDALYELVRTSNGGPRGVHSILIAFMGFGQLGPISGQYISSSKAWASARFAVLQGNFRQQGDQYRQVVANLSNMTTLTTQDVDYIARFFNKDLPAGEQNSTVITLVPDTASADEINTQHFSALEGVAQTYLSIDTQSGLGETVPLTSYLKHSPLPSTISLKEGALVMVVLNQDVNMGIVNGLAGTVVKINDPNTAVGEIARFPAVSIRDANGKLYSVQAAEHKIELGDTESSVTRTNLPLVLAWGMTIHKGQGQTISTFYQVILTHIESVFRDLATRRALFLVAFTRGTEAEKVCFEYKPLGKKPKLPEIRKLIKKLCRHRPSDPDVKALSEVKEKDILKSLGGMPTA
jgi:hypothetical protein